MNISSSESSGASQGYGNGSQRLDSLSPWCGEIHAVKLVIVDYHELTITSFTANNMTVNESYSQ